ncbi:MAG: ROK family protein [Candidatus Rokuibacteriota bacterium]|jgi:glucokinase|nr:ROK family protein [Patescibacteria group bacterium]
MRDPADDRGVIIAVDVGGSSIAGGLVTPHGDVLSHARRRTRGGEGGDPVERLLDVVAEVYAEARQQGISVQGVGVGLPSIVDVERGMMVSDQNFVPEFKDVPVADHIRRQTGLTTWVDNDANAMALGELRWGVARGRDVSSLVLITIGTGVGGALVVDGALVRGRDGYAGEFGHLSVMMNGPICFCGGRGCMCAFVCGTAIEQSAQLRLRTRPDSKLLTLAGGEVTAVTTAVVFEAASGGDGLARAIVDEACEALAATLGGLLNSLNPDMIVITGGVVQSLAPLRDDILQRTTKYALARVLDDARVHLIPSDKSSSMRGAAALFLYESGRRGLRPAANERR